MGGGSPLRGNEGGQPPTLVLVASTDARYHNSTSQMAHLSQVLSLSDTCSRLAHLTQMALLSQMAHLTHMMHLPQRPPTARGASLRLGARGQARRGLPILHLRLQGILDQSAQDGAVLTSSANHEAW